MNPKTLHCPCCGKPLKILQMMRNRHYCDRDTYICLCNCGAYDITLDEGKITSVILRVPRETSLYDR